MEIKSPSLPRKPGDNPLTAKVENLKVFINKSRNGVRVLELKVVQEQLNSWSHRHLIKETTSFQGCLDDKINKTD